MTNPMLNRLTGKQVLVVEDEYLLAQDIASHLARHGVAVVGPVGTVFEAQRLAEGCNIDCAIIDLQLRGETAYDLVDFLIRASVPVLIISGYHPSDLPHRFRHLSFIQKPAPLGRDGVSIVLDGMINTTKH